MPVYTYKCQEGHLFAITVGRSQCMESQPCPCGCGGQGTRTVGSPSFVQRGDGWVGKNQTIKGQMKAKNARLGVKSQERSHGSRMRLVPNVDGEQVDSWEDAKKLACEKGKDTSGHDSLIQQERKA